MDQPPLGRRLEGRLDEHVVTSDVLRGNRLGDPHERPLWVYTADALFAALEAPPCLLVFVDCWTSLGGSQFVDSPATPGPNEPPQSACAYCP